MGLDLSGGTYKPISPMQGAAQAAKTNADYMDFCRDYVIECE